MGCSACTMLRLVWEQAILVNCGVRTEAASHCACDLPGTLMQPR